MFPRPLNAAREDISPLVTLSSSNPGALGVVHAGDSTRLIASLARFGEAIRAARAAGTT